MLSMSLLMVKSTETSGETGGNCFDWEDGAHMRSKSVGNKTWIILLFIDFFILYSIFVLVSSILFVFCLSEGPSCGLRSVSASELGYIYTNIRHTHTSAYIHAALSLLNSCTAAKTPGFRSVWCAEKASFLLYVLFVTILWPKKIVVFGFF